MSYEINLIAIGQEKPIHLKSENKVLLHNEIENYEVNRYAEIWSFFSCMEGILYSLVMEMNEGFYSSFPLCDSDFQTVLPEKMAPYWVSQKVKEYLTPFILKDDTYEEVVNIIEYVLEQSPHKRILFQTRYEGGDNEVVLGTVKISKFKKMLKKKKILFNVCYILESDS